MARDQRSGKSQLAAARHRWVSAALILLAAALATAPIVMRGNFCGDDFEFHFSSWIDAHESWRHGIFFPHWMASANFGAGEPRFQFYPPLTWMLGAALSFIVPWPVVAPLMIFAFLAATGFATRALSREMLSEDAATLAGCITLFSGFALFTAYERAAFAELTGGFWIPLILLFELRKRDFAGSLARRVLDGSTVPLAIAFAGAWLSDGPVGLMATYLLIAVAVARSILDRSFAPLLRSALSGLMGAALAAFYLVPLFHEQRWIDLQAATSVSAFQIENNWLFKRHTGVDWIPFDAFIHRASIIAVIVLGTSITCGIFPFVRYRWLAPWKSELNDRTTPFLSSTWILLGVIPVAVLLLQFPFSESLWNLLPKLRFLQYPWRWLVVATAPMAILLVAAIWPHMDSSRRRRALIAIICSAACIASTAISAKSFLRACKSSQTASGILDRMHVEGGLNGTDEYEPPNSDHWKIARGLPDACFVTDPEIVLGVVDAPDAQPVWRPDQHSCETVFTAQMHSPRSMRIAFTATHDGFAILKLTRFPAWRILINGQAAQSLDADDLRDDGLIAVPVKQGPVDLAADWHATPDVLLGRWISTIASLFVLCVAYFERKMLHLSVKVEK